MGWEKASGEVGPERGWVECEPTCEKRVLDHALPMAIRMPFSEELSTPMSSRQKVKLSNWVCFQLQFQRREHSRQIGMRLPVPRLRQLHCLKHSGHVGRIEFCWSGICSLSRCEHNDLKSARQLCTTRMHNDLHKLDDVMQPVPEARKAPPHSMMSCRGRPRQQSPQQRPGPSCRTHPGRAPA